MNVFVYGTLLVPRIWNLVTDCPELIPKKATLKGHSIWRVKEATFPAIREETGNSESTVSGLVFFDVPAPAIQRLDAYEDTFYERVPVLVDTRDGIVEAQVYRVPAKISTTIVSTDTWTLEWFEQNGLEQFLENIFER